MKIPVIAHPNSKKPHIEVDLLGNLHVYVKEPPLQNKANNAIVLALARHFSVKNAAVELTHGFKSKNKVFEIYK